MENLEKVILIENFILIRMAHIAAFHLQTVFEVRILKSGAKKHELMIR